MVNLRLWETRDAAGLACVAGVWKGRGFGREGNARGARGGAPLAFLSHLKLPFPSLSNACHAGNCWWSSKFEPTETQNHPENETSRHIKTCWWICSNQDISRAETAAEYLITSCQRWWPVNSFPQDSNYAFDNHYVRVLSKTKQRQKKGEMEVSLRADDN